MSLLRRALPLVLLLAFAAPATAGPLAKPKPAAPPKAPNGLHAFLLRSDEPPTDAFPRTPSFAWSPVPGAQKYDFELATSSTFAETSVLWSGSVSGTPALAVPLALPWMTGKPYALYARVRTVVKSKVSPWGTSFGFNMRAADAPLQVSSYPGLIHWSIVPGATSYQVWWSDIGKQISSLMTYADEREFYTFHQLAPWPSVVHWRVRAVRSVYGSVVSGLPVVAYGPWSQIYTSYNPPFGLGALSASSTVSETVDANGSADASEPHSHTPAFLFNGNVAYDGTSMELFRVYVFTDKECVNQVYRGAIVGSPAYSPRPSGPLALPSNATDLAKARAAYLVDGSEGNTFGADLSPVKTTESGDAKTLAAVDLWDSGWPSGRYFWTVVPVRIAVDQNGGITYRDTELPQEACGSGREGSFGKVSDPVLVADHATETYTANAPFASGLSTDGKLVAAAKPTPTFYGTPLVAWLPALGADSYEVQWGRSLYPWKVEGKLTTSGTSTLLADSKGGPTPGVWYYRVRGVDPFVAGSLKAMTWSDPVKILVSKPIFKVVGKLPTVPKKK